jgi:hypothetical protein
VVDSYGSCVQRPSFESLKNHSYLKLMCVECFWTSSLSYKSEDGDEGLLSETHLSLNLDHGRACERILLPASTDERPQVIRYTKLCVWSTWPSAAKNGDHDLHTPLTWIRDRPNIYLLAANRVSQNFSRKLEQCARAGSALTSRAVIPNA